MRDVSETHRQVVPGASYIFWGCFFFDDLVQGRNLPLHLAGQSHT